MVDMDEEYVEAERLAAEKLREARRERGLTQVDVADDMAQRGFRWSQPTVARVERGHRHLSLAEARPHGRSRAERGPGLPAHRPHLAQELWRRLCSSWRAPCSFLTRIRAALVLRGRQIRLDLGRSIAPDDTHVGGQRLLDWRPRTDR